MPAVTSSDRPFVLRTLGGLGLYRQGEDVPLIPSGKPIALVVYLSALPDHRTNREHLLNLLWTDREPAPARHALRQTVWYLRQRLGDDALEVGNEHITLTASVAWDRDSFLSAIEAGRIAEAIEVYRGEFLGGFAVPGGLAFEHWAEAECRRLELLFRHAAESLARERLTEGQFRAARELARRVRDGDPFDESGWRLLIEACLAHDDRISALAESQRLHQLLAAEERTPEPATQALLRRVNAQPAEVERPDDGALVTEMVGREREFSALAAAFTGARHGPARVAVVTAPAGLGKTRLLLDLARRLAAAGTPAVYVRAQPGDRDIPGSYLAEVARQLAGRPGARGVSPASASSLVALDPSISGRFPALPDSATGDDARRHRVAALAELIEAVAAERPFALLLDDLHWGDAYSRDALEHAISRARAARVLFVCATRPGGALRGVELDEKRQLQPFTVAQVEALLSTVASLPAQSWAADFPTQLHSAGEGSPLLVLETLQLALETGALSRTNGAWECADPAALEALLKAGSALGRRLDQLDRHEHWLLLLLAAAGTPLPTETLVRASGQAQERTQGTLHALERRGLVSRDGNQWSVAHDEIAERCAAGADPRQVTATHAALGRTLLAASRDASDLRSAARHLAAASLEEDLAAVAGRWVRQAQANGDRRPARALLADLLGAGRDDDLVRRLTGSLPWHQRAGRGMRMAVMVTAAALAVTGVAALASRSGSAGPGVLMAIWTHEASGHWRMRARAITQQDVAHGIIDIKSLKATDVLSPSQAEGVLRPGDPSMLATTSAYPDSGGVEVAVTTAGQPGAARLTHSRGDDFARAWSPDGRWLVIATDRWTNRSRTDLLIVDPDHPDSAVRRLTFNARARDETPLWSPDGTRVAFLRSSIDSPPTSLCVVSVDAHGERCFNVPGHTASVPLGWINAVEVAGQFTDSAGDPQILAVNTLDGTYRLLLDGLELAQSHVPGWIACYCRRSTAEPYQPMVLPAARPDHAIRILPAEPPPAVVLFPAATPRSFLGRIAIAGAEHPIPRDGAYKLRLEGWNADGDPAEPLAARWGTNDTAAATIDSAGVVHPRREGRVLVRVTAGGWRSDSAWVTIGPPEAQTVTVENWRRGIEAPWVPFGTPPPYTGRVRGEIALVPNGDSTWSNGVYLDRRLPAIGGLGVELRLSTPLTSPEWQEFALLLVSADSLNTGAWDLRRGELPIPNEQWRECAARYPSSESEVGHGSLRFTWGIYREVPAPPSMPTGRWTRLRLQLFPDGRCGLAVDGRALSILERLAPPGDSMMVLLESRSFHTRIAAGPIEVWLGVRRDVDWDVVGRRGAAPMSPAHQP